MNAFKTDSEDLIAQLHNLGFDLKYVMDYLKEFNEYCAQFFPDECTLTKELAESWIYSSHTSSKQQMDKRIRTMKHLGKYLNSIGREAYIPNYRIACDPPTPPVLLDDRQLLLFFDTCDHIGKAKRSGYREYILPVIFRLIYSCGLRSSEACKLKVLDVNLETGGIEIYHSKGFKDRKIYMSDTMLHLCKDFNDVYSKILIEREYFFQPSQHKLRYLNTDICAMFNLILKKSNLETEFSKKPTPHGLRHLFAVKSMKKCLNENHNFENWIKYLSQYMGHSSPQETMYYLHMVALLLPEYSNKIRGLTEGIGVVYEED